MADDRHEAYREMFTRSKIREMLDSMDSFERSSFVYECIHHALNANFDTRHFVTVNNIITEVQNEQS